MMRRALGAGILWQKMTIREGEADKKLRLPESVQRAIKDYLQGENEQILYLDCLWDEFLITILSSQAQEESRNLSENTRWGIVRNFEQGLVHINIKVLWDTPGLRTEILRNKSFLQGRTRCCGHQNYSSREL